MDNPTTYGVWIKFSDGSGHWLTGGEGLIFQSLSKGCAEAQKEQFTRWQSLHHLSESSSGIATVLPFDH